ncbi:MAG: MarR family transcriptional regulator [Actinobacteria bacterium]|nr:MarR family transcriptional regulator [Actinomycetota bacterium]
MPTPAQPDTAIRGEQIAALQDVSLLLTRRVRKHSQTDLTMSQISALSTILRHGPIRVGELARREQISKSSTTRLVAKLEAMGYLQRSADPDDGRSFVVGITPNGHELLASARARANDYLVHQIGRLSEDDRLAILAALPSLQRLTGLS